MTTPHDTRDKIRREIGQRSSGSLANKTQVGIKSMEQINTIPIAGAIFFDITDTPCCQSENPEEDEDLGYCFSHLAQWYEGRE